MCRLSRNLEASISWNPQGLSRPVTGIALISPSEIYKWIQLNHPEGLIKTTEGKRQDTSVTVEAVTCETRARYLINQKQVSKYLTAEWRFQWLMLKKPEVRNCKHVKQMNLNFTGDRECNSQAFFTILHIYTSLQPWCAFVVHGRFQVVAPCTAVWGPAVWGGGAGGEQRFLLCIRFFVQSISYVNSYISLPAISIDYM
jgi:hypothetical protein